MRWPSRTGMTTTEVSGMLYGLGLVVSRDRVYKLADRLFPEAEMRPNGQANRRFTDEQVTVLRAAFVLLDLFGIPYRQLPEIFAQPEGMAETMRQELERRAVAVAVSQEGLAEALACVSISDHSAEGHSSTAAAGRRVA